MSILLAPPTTADYDLTSPAIVLSHEMVAAGDVRVVVRVGTAAKPCVLLAGVWKLYFYVGFEGAGYNSPSYPQEILATAGYCKLFFNKVCDVPAGALVGLLLKSPNIGDTDVTVTAEIWHVSGSLPAVVPGAVGGLPVLNADGYVEADAKAVRAQALGAKAGLNFNTLFQNGGVDSALMLTGDYGATGGIAWAVWTHGYRTLTSFGSLVTNIWSAATRTLTAVTGLGIATEAKQDTAALVLARMAGLVQENFYIDNYVWSTGRCTSFRMRIYSDAASVGTAANVLATYNVTATYTAGKPATYKVVKA